MSERSNRSDHVDDLAAVATAISTAAVRVNNFSSRIAALSNISITQALKTPTLSSTAAQMIAQGQLLATCCQCPAVTSPQATSETWLTHLEAAESAFVISAALLGGTKLWADAIKCAGAGVLGRIVKTSGGILVRMAGPIVRAIAESEALAIVVDAARELIAAVAALVASAPLAAIGATARGGVTYSIWRERGAIARGIRSLDAGISHEAMKLWSELVPTGPDGSEEDGDKGSPPASEQARRRSGWRRLRSIARSILNPVGAGLATIEPLVLSPSWYASLLPSSVSAGFVEGATVAMLAAPLLVSPALAAIPARGTSAEAIASDSVVINSSPTITINASDCGDIEQRVLAALREHREELYAQWCNELQRRQRTEF
jgi:hypothetical protein